MGRSSSLGVGTTEAMRGTVRFTEANITLSKQPPSPLRIWFSLKIGINGEHRCSLIFFAVVVKVY